MFKYVLVALAANLCVTTQAYAKPQQTTLTPIIIADTVTKTMSLSPKINSLSAAPIPNDIRITRSGSAFIKVHFSYFSLPTGAYVTVSTPDGKESYSYDGQTHKTATFDRNKGENGLSQFSAMSVFGDTAIVTLVMPAGRVWESHHGIKIDNFNAGHSETYDDQSQSVPLIDVITPQSTCGVNERRDVACWQSTHSVEYERSRPVARLLMAGSGLCTGWRVSNDNRMFTNNHCLSTQGKLENTEIWFNYQRSNCGGSSNVATIKVTGRELLQTDYDLDYSLFTVNNFADITQFGNFGLEPRAPSLGETIYIAQHGAGNPKELAIESDQNSGGLCQIDTASANGRAAGSDAGYFCDTTGGSSGSPVIVRSSKQGHSFAPFWRL
ncbi:Trypsin-like peptidase domain [Shewanella psychrophila]|uniref:Trypsin-like peptidase domain n=1 Tax=Shewanella psychrophila TaxID=225848 RepID=A0A1S6HQ79_9GAMM|nr:serine protease [Shewanella psychrophila]AQS37669.1 Trypsin-like peptidase domain [Shewanella psychrophila]